MVLSPHQNSCSVGFVVVFLLWFACPEVKRKLNYVPLFQIVLIIFRGFCFAFSVALWRVTSIDTVERCLLACMSSEMIYVFAMLVLQKL